MPRPRKCRMISCDPTNRFYKPQGVKMCDLAISVLSHDQLESLKLADSDKLDQIVAAKKMNISRSTFSRLVNEARSTVAEALVNGWALKIDGGDFQVKPDKNSNELNKKG